MPLECATVANVEGEILSPPSGMSCNVSLNMRKAFVSEIDESAVAIISRNSLKFRTPSWFASPALNRVSNDALCCQIATIQI